MKGSENKTGELSRNELRTWTKHIMAKKHPGSKFNEEMFDKGFKTMDVNKDGTINIEDIKMIVINKCKKEKLYVGKK